MEEESTPQSPGCRRRAGRLDQELVDSNYGIVLDLSSNGARIDVPRAIPTPEGEITLRLNGYGMYVEVPCHVVWTQPRARGAKSRTIGVQFHELTLAQRQTLTDLATTGRLRRAI